MYFCCTLRKRTYFVLTHVSRVFYAVPVALCAFLCTICVHCAKGAQCINARQPSFLCRAGCLMCLLMYFCCTLRKRTYFVLTHVSRVFYAVPVALCAFLCTICVHCAKGAQCINARQPSFLCRAGCLMCLLMYFCCTLRKRRTMY